MEWRKRRDNDEDDIARQDSGKNGICPDCIKFKRSLCQIRGLKSCDNVIIHESECFINVVMIVSQFIENCCNGFVPLNSS